MTIACGENKMDLLPLHRQTKIQTAMIEIPQNEVQTNDYDKVVIEVLTQLNTGKVKYGEGLVGTAYIDWGVTSDYYQNCPSKIVADKVAMTFKEKGVLCIYPAVWVMVTDASSKVLLCRIAYIKKLANIIIGMNYDTRARNDGDQPFP